MGNIIFWLLFIGAMFWMHKKGMGCCGGHGHNHNSKQRQDHIYHHGSRNHPSIDTDSLHRDPVCGSYLAEEVAIKKEVDGQIYYFCSHSCEEKFLRERR